MSTTNKMPAMYDLSTYYAAGIDPKTGLPLKLSDNQINSITKAEIKK